MPDAPAEAAKVQYNSSATEVKAVYMRLARKIHPDKLQAVAPAQAAYGQALFEVIHSSYEKFKERERL